MNDEFDILPIESADLMSMTPGHRRLLKSALAGLVIGCVVPLIVRPEHHQHALLFAVALGVASGLAFGLGARLLGRHS